MTALEHRVPPPIVALCCALLAWLSMIWDLRLDFDTAVVHACGTALAVLGAIVAVRGVRAFQRAATTINPLKPDEASALVEADVYRFTRNPMYLGMALILLGWAVGLARPLALLGPVLFVAWITRFQILPEERILRLKFGAGYESYCRRVRRWI
ncbi:MAG: isoprenylcysteine carboxylmethyltransferase family protein [Xanthomonadales bacterium]|nr:isoprenylcysteine carboxylmethyltransferase family protein [Xanthomonadales bacterium]